MREIVHSIEELSDFVFRFVSRLEKGNTARVVSLSGDLGSGKTSFVQLLAKHVGVEDDVTSPTFVIQ